MLNPWHGNEIRANSLRFLSQKTRINLGSFDISSLTNRLLSIGKDIREKHLDGIHDVNGDRRIFSNLARAGKEEGKWGKDVRLPGCPFAAQCFS